MFEKAHRATDVFSAIAIAALLVMTALGNATAMLLVSLGLLALGWVLFGRSQVHRSIGMTVVAFVIAASVALMVFPLS